MAGAEPLPADPARQLDLHLLTGTGFARLLSRLGGYDYGVPNGTSMFPDRYRDPELVARGGMGAVYCATDASLDRAVAIKVLDQRLASDGTVRQRFEREAHTAARLSGEAGIVTIYDVGEWNGRPFIVMEYVRGGSLQDVLQRGGPQPPSAVLRWLEQTARALDHAHERGVVHRDVKPSNLLLDESGRVHVADFGIASAAGLASLTQTGTVIGTAGYLSPEQAQGLPASPASDRYALGIVAFELLTGARPFENDNSTAEAAAHVHAPIPAISQLARNVPLEVDTVFERALAKDPSQRFATCARFVAALRAAFADAAGSTRVVAPRPAPHRRRVWPLAVPVLALAGIAAGIVVATQRDSGSGRALRTVTRSGTPVTVTQQGTTVVQTVTAREPGPATTSPATSTPAAAGTAAAGQTLALAGYNQLRAGNYAVAVPLLQRAADLLRGSGTANEAYNDYNLAYALLQTVGCSDTVRQLLDASEAIQGRRKEIERLRSSCRPT